MHINYHVVGGFFDEFSEDLEGLSCELNISALHQILVMDRTMFEVRSFEAKNTVFEFDYQQPY